MSVFPFTRSLGKRSGVQLNYPLDNSERFVPGDESQVFAGVGRFTRGRIDRAFPVNRDQLSRLLGAPVSISVSLLNEAMVQIYEAFLNGAQRAVISRLIPAAASLKWMVASLPADPDEDPVWTISTTEAAPTANFLLAIRHLECFNEGVRAEIHAEATTVEGVPAPSKRVRLRLFDLDETQLFEFWGSLDPLAKDDFGQSLYLPDVISAQTNDLDCVVLTAAAVPTTAPFYGLDIDSNPKVSAADLVYFTEGSTSYTGPEIDRAMNALRNTQYPFGYLAGLGTQTAAVISKLGPLAMEINKQLILDAPGTLSVDAAITFANQFNFNTHYVQWYWAPLRATDPLNGGKVVFGVSGAQVGLRCRRNARTDANGVPPMNYPVAGKDWSLTRTGTLQQTNPSDADLEKLAIARINPVISQTYTNAQLFVFTDSLTSVKSESDRKLIAVAEMSTQIDDWVTAAVKEYLQLPMSESLKRTSNFLRILFDGVQAAKWLVPSAELDGSSYIAEVKPNAQRPKDRLDVNYWLSFDGTTRAIYVQQTISK